MNLKKIGANIRKERKEQDVRPSKMASDLGITYQYVWEIESKGRNISLEMLGRIADYLKVTPCALLSEEE